MTAAGLDFTLQESNIFSEVGVTAYWTAAFNMGLPYPFSFVESPPVPDFGPLAMLRYSNESPIATAYSFGPSPYNQTTSDTDEQVKDLLVQSANSLGVGLALNHTGGVTAPIVVEKEDIKLFTRQDHFPHVLTDALNSGFYES